MTEVWRPIIGHLDRYEVSNEGRVRSLMYPAKGGSRRRAVPLILKLRSPRNDGYLTVELMGKTHFVHALVAEAFLGPRPFPEAQCRHDDGDPGNNRSTNLLWGTAAENQQDRLRHGTDVRALKHPKGKVSDTQVSEIKRRLKAGEEGSALAREFGVSPQLVSGFATGALRPWVS
jgi:hypothetical protein